MDTTRINHNNSGHKYRIAVDIAKEGSHIWDLTPYFKGRVGDNNFGLQVTWYYQGQLMNVVGMKPYIEGLVGQYSFGKNGEIDMDPDAVPVRYDGSPDDCEEAGKATFYFPSQMFPKEGIFKGFIGVKDDRDSSKNPQISGVTIWFKVLPGIAQMGHACDAYVDELDKALQNFKVKLDQHDKDYQTQLQQVIDDSRNAYESETKNAHDSLDALKSQIQANRDEQANLEEHLTLTDTKITDGDVVTNKHFNDVTEKLGTDIQNKLSQISSTVPWLKDSATIMEKYPNGYAGVVVAADTMHKWVYYDGMWNDAGQYKEDLTENGEIIAYLDYGAVLTWDPADNQCSLNLSNISTGLTIRGAINISITKDDIYKAFNSSTVVKLKDDIVSGLSFALIFYLSSQKLGVINPTADTISPDAKILFLHHYTSVNAGLLVDSQLPTQANNFSNLIDETNQKIGDSSYAYISGENNDFSLNYQQGDCKIKFGSDWVELWSAGKLYDIKVSDILAAANKATGIVTVNSDNSISPGPDGRFTIYYDTATKTINFIDHINTRITPTGVRLFTHQYDSADSGLLVDYAVTHGFFTLQKSFEELKKDTEKNFEELKNEIEKNKVPDYFVDNLNSGIDRVNENMGIAGINSFTFLFITDVHWNGNTKNSPALVKEMVKKTGIPLMINGGDLFDQGERIPMMQDATQSIGLIKQPGVFMAMDRGNHDNNWNDWDGQHDHPERKFSYNDIYGYEFAYMMRDKNLVDDFHYLNTGKDFTYTFTMSDGSGKVWRFISADTQDLSQTTNIDINSFNSIIDLLQNSKNENIIFTAHIFSNNHNHTDFEKDLEKVIDARNSCQTATISFRNIDFTKADSTTKIIACIGGHEHEDYDWKSPNGVPFILTDCDNAPRTETTKYGHDAGTIGEQCFDVMTIDLNAKKIKAVRIGRGVDREFDLPDFKPASN